jgi:hypothetical protein
VIFGSVTFGLDFPLRLVEQTRQRQRVAMLIRLLERI